MSDRKDIKDRLEKVSLNLICLETDIDSIREDAKMEERSETWDSIVGGMEQVREEIHSIEEELENE